MVKMRPARACMNKAGGAFAVLSTWHGHEGFSGQGLSDCRSILVSRVWLLASGLGVPPGGGTRLATPGMALLLGSLRGHGPVLPLSFTFMHFCSCVCDEEGWDDDGGGELL